MTAVQRFLPPEYADGMQAPRTTASAAAVPLPSAREVSAAMHEDRRLQPSAVTHLLMQWGQFIDHDLTSASQSRGFNGSVPRCCRDGGRDVESGDFLHPECFPILVPANDPFYRKFGIRCLEFLRSSPASRQDCELGWREQINQVTAYMDASPLYGSSVRQSDNLRLFRNGMLQYGRVQSRKPLLPPERDDKDELCRRGAVSSDCFKSGDNRVNEHPGLVAMHIVWLRIHNRMANELAHLNSHWSDEKIYQETRKIIGAMVQHITYNEFLPIVLGAEVMKLFDLKLLKKGFYRGYSKKVNASPGNAFGAAAFRFGHSLVQPSFMRYNRFHEPISGNVSLHEEIANPDNLWSFSAVDHLLTGMIDQPSQKRDEFITDELTNHLFQTSRFRFGMDLAAINIQRGRDHGLPPYITWRDPCGLTAIDDWSDLYKIMSPRSVNRLQDIYRHVADIDLFTGGMCERPVIGGLVGPTFACIIAQQFSNIRQGDRFWYENGNFESSFTPAQLQQIRKVTLAQVLCRSLDSIITIQPFVFLSADDTTNERLPCDSDYIDNFELSPWTERQTDTDVDNDIRNFEKIDKTSQKPLPLQNSHEKIKSSSFTNVTKTASKPSHPLATDETNTLIDNKLDFDLPEHKLPNEPDNDATNDNTFELESTTEQHKLDDKLDFRRVKAGLDLSTPSAKRNFEINDSQQGGIVKLNEGLEGTIAKTYFELERPLKHQRAESSNNYFYTHLGDNLNYDAKGTTEKKKSVFETNKRDNSYSTDIQDTHRATLSDRNIQDYQTKDTKEIDKRLNSYSTEIQETYRASINDRNRHDYQTKDIKENDKRLNSYSTDIQDTHQAFLNDRNRHDYKITDMKEIDKQLNSHSTNVQDTHRVSLTDRNGHDYETKDNMEIDKQDNLYSTDVSDKNRHDYETKDMKELDKRLNSNSSGIHDTQQVSFNDRNRHHYKTKDMKEIDKQDNSYSTDSHDTHQASLNDRNRHDYQTKDIKEIDKQPNSYFAVIQDMHQPSFNGRNRYDYTPKDSEEIEKKDFYYTDIHDRNSDPTSFNPLTDIHIPIQKPTQSLGNDENGHDYKTESMKDNYQNFENIDSPHRPIDDYQTDIRHKHRNQYQSNRLYNLRPIKVTENMNRFTYLVNIVPKTTPKYHHYRDPIKLTFQNSFPQRYQYSNLNTKPVYQKTDFVQRPMILFTDRNEYKNDGYFNTDTKWTKYNTDRTTIGQFDDVEQNAYDAITNKPDSTDETSEKNYRLVTFNHINDLYHVPETTDKTMMTSSYDDVSLKQDKIHYQQQNSNFKTDNTDSTKVVNVPVRNIPIHNGIIKDNILLQEMNIPLQNDKLSMEKQQMIKKTIHNRQTVKLDSHVNPKLAEVTPHSHDALQSDDVATPKLAKQEVTELTKQNVTELITPKLTKQTLTELIKQTNLKQDELTPHRRDTIQSDNITTPELMKQTVTELIKQTNLKQDKLTPHRRDTIQSHYISTPKLTKQTVTELTKQDMLLINDNDKQNNTMTRFDKQNNTVINNLKTIIDNTSKLSNVQQQNLTYDLWQNRNDSIKLNTDKHHKLQISSPEKKPNLRTNDSDFDNTKKSSLKQYSQENLNFFNQSDKHMTLTTKKTDNKFVTFSSQDSIKQLTKHTTETNKATNIDTDKYPKPALTSATTVRYFYINNILHKYPQPNMADYDSSSKQLKRPIGTANRQNLTIIDENYNNPWKKVLADRVEFSDLNTNFRAQTNSKKDNNIMMNEKKNNSQRSSPHVKLQELKNKNINSKKGSFHVGFDVIPSENSPNLWTFYHEQEDTSKVPLRAMPQIASDPQALKEFPRPIDNSIIQNYKKKSRPRGH